MGSDYDPIQELAKLPFPNPDAGHPGAPSAKGHPKLHVVAGEPLPALTAKIRASIPPSKYLLHIHAPGDGVEALRASRTEGERTLFLEITPDDKMLGKLSGLLRTLRPDHADMTVQTTSNPIIVNAIPKIRMALDLEMPNLHVDRKSALTRLRCSLLNLPGITKSPRLSAKLLNPAMPALVCGAGPSLSGQLDFIRENAGRFLLVACGHAAIKMKEAGFEPDFVVEADPRCRINWNRLKEDVSSPLAALSCVDPAVCSRFKRIIWFEGDSPEFSAFVKALGVGIDRAAMSRGVIVTAIDFAFKVGCGKVALLGCDLALSSDGATHAGSRRADDDALSIMEVEGHAPGSKVRTTRDFNEIRKALESYLEHSNRRGLVCNCTPDGARIEGIEHTTIKNFIEANCPAPADVKFELVETPHDASWFDPLRISSAHLRKYMEASRKVADCARKLAAALSEASCPQKAKAAFDDALKEEAATFKANGMSQFFLLPKRTAEDYVDETPGSNVTALDALGQLRIFEMRANLAASICADLKGDIDHAIASIRGEPQEPRDPANFQSFREMNVEAIAKSNSELASAIASKTLPSAASEGFSLHLRFEDTPHISKTLPDGTKVQFSGLLSGPSEAWRTFDAFAKGFDPKRHAAIIVAPGNYALVERFASRFQDSPCLLIDPWPGLFAELAGRCVFLHRLPEGSTVVVAHDSLKSWRDILAKAIARFKAHGLEPRPLLNPRTACLPEVKAILELKELA